MTLTRPIILQICWAIVAALVVAMVVVASTSIPGCSPPPIRSTPPMAPRVNLVPLNSAITNAGTKGIATTQPTTQLVQAFEDHQDDQAPTANFVAQWLPLARQAAAAADATLRAINSIGIAAVGVKEQADVLFDTQAKIHGAATENEHAATVYKASAEHERNSIFGGLIGHWLWRGMWLAIGLGGLFLLSKILLLAFPATGFINATATFTGVHPVTNIVQTFLAALWSAAKFVARVLLSAAKAIAAGLWSAAKATGRGLYWFYDQKVLRHVPDGSPIYTPKTTGPGPAVPLAIIGTVALALSLSN